MRFRYFGCVVYVWNRPVHVYVQRICLIKDAIIPDAVRDEWGEILTEFGRECVVCRGSAPLYFTGKWAFSLYSCLTVCTVLVLSYSRLYGFCVVRKGKRKRYNDIFITLNHQTSKALLCWLHKPTLLHHKSFIFGFWTFCK